MKKYQKINQVRSKQGEWFTEPWVKTVIEAAEAMTEFYEVLRRRLAVHCQTPSSEVHVIQGLTKR